MTIMKYAKLLPPSTKGKIYEITVDAPGGGEDKLSYQFDGAEMDVLNCLFVHGPTWDGNIPSKSARDELCRHGLVFHAQGFATITGAGMIVCINAELIVKEWKDQRWATKLTGERLRVAVDNAHAETIEPSITADDADPPETVVPGKGPNWTKPVGSIRVVWNPEGYVPKFQHYSVDSARAEARRLASEVPGARFLVLESIGEFSVERPVPKWTPHDQTVEPGDDEIPF